MRRFYFSPTFLFSVGLFFITLFFVPHAAFALGISPANTVVDDVLPGTEVKRTIYISRGNPEKEEKATVVIGGAAATYITSPQGTTITLPAGENNTPYEITIAPGSLAAGTYTATITIAPTAEGDLGLNTSEEQVSAGSYILSGAQATIQFTVSTEEKESYIIQNVTIDDAEEHIPVGFSYLMENTGNVDARPSNIELTVTDELDASNSATETIDAEKLSIVPAFKQETVNVLSNITLKTGIYKVRIVFYQDDTVIYTADTLRLQVWPTGSLAQEGTFIDFQTDKTSYSTSELIQFTGRFENTGSVGLESTFVVELFIGKKRIEVLKGDSVFVPAGKTATVEQTYRPLKSGNYTAVGYVTYGPFQTDKKEITFDVTGISLIVIIIALAVLTALLIAGAFWWRKHKHSSRNAHPSKG